MATNLAGDICIGSHSVCLLRAATLGPDCAPLGGEDSGIVTPGIVTLTATPQVQDDTTFEPENGCGETLWTYSKLGRIRRYDITGEIGYHDWEMMEVLFGGELILGGAGGDYVGEVIGWALGDYTDPDPAPVYLEIFVLNAGAGVGDCAGGDTDFPPVSSHIFGKVRLRPDATTYSREERMVTFTGVAESNPNLGLGPWEDWPGDGTVRTSPYQTVSYSQTQFDAILADARCGYQALPEAGS